jgi:hypothetical protein
MTVMVFYGAGFVGIFTVLAVMYWRAWRLRDEIQLDAAERAAVRGALRGHLLSVSIGVLSLVLAIFVPNVAALSGLVYFLMGPAQGINGYLTGVAVERAASHSSLES